MALVHFAHYVQRQMRQYFDGGAKNEDLFQAILLFMRQKQFSSHGLLLKHIQHKRNALIITVHSSAAKYQLHMHREELMNFLNKQSKIRGSIKDIRLL